MTNLQSYYNNPANFLYIFAGDSFIAKLGRTASYVISRKKANQKKLLNTAAVDAGTTYNAAMNKIAESFKELYGMTPANALITLANGGEVAGKNWKAGVYGIGKEVSVNFTAPGANSAVTIGDNGQFYQRSYDGSGSRTLTTEIVSYGKDGNPNCVKYTDASGNVYTANYNKRSGWSASNFSNASTGQTYTADGAATNASNMASIWESLALNLSKLIEWLISLFNSTNNTELKAITAANTQPTQGDGWVYESGVSPAVLIAVGLGTLVAAGGFGGFLKSAKKSKK